MVRRRLRREPVAYILGRKGFRRIELAVDRRVLIPRPETELLVEVALELEPGTVLDVGTGSGAIALAIADELPGRGRRHRHSSGARVARQNAGRLGLGGRVASSRHRCPHGRFDLLVANLPYVTEGEWEGLEPEIRDLSRAARSCRGRRARGDRACSASGRAVRRPRRRRSRSGTAGRGGRGAGAPGRIRRPRSRRDLAGIAGGRGGSLDDRDRLGRARRRGTPLTALESYVGGGGVAVFPADGLYGFACDPLQRRSHPRSTGSRAGTGKPSAVLFFSPLPCASCWQLAPDRAASARCCPARSRWWWRNPKQRYPLACRETPNDSGFRLIEGPLAGGRAPVFQTSANYR